MLTKATRIPAKRISAVCAGALLAASCAVTSPDPALLDNAALAVEQAAAAGAEEHAPLEMRFAREKLEAATALIDTRQGTEAHRLADEAELEARLALARTRAARARAELAERRRELEQLEADLVAAYGEEVLER